MDINKYEDKPWEFEVDEIDPFTSKNFYEKIQPYRILYEYLKLSPTFALAIKEDSYKKPEGIEKYLREVKNKAVPEFTFTRNELTYLPLDYKDIVKTLNEQTKGGWDFSETGFRDWWCDIAIKIFDQGLIPPAIQLIKVPHHTPVDDEKILEAWHRKSWFRLHKERGFALIAVPLIGNKKNAMKSIDKMIQSKDFKPYAPPNKLFYKLEKGKQLEKLDIGLRVLWIAALEPELPLWKIGLLARITENTDYTDLDINLPKQSEDDKYKTEYLASMTSRKLKESLIIMENAARGRFPCNNPDCLSPFKKDKSNQIDIDKILKLVRKSMNRRQKNELSRAEFLRSYYEDDEDVIIEDNGKIKFK
jgi:hypothetical protein